MTILETIKKDQLQARKAGEKFKATVLTTLLSEIANIGKNDGNRETKDEEALKVIAKFVKGVKENITLVGENEDLKNELNIYLEYLPKQLTESELKNEIDKIKKALDTDSIGLIMKNLNENFKGQFDGKMASILIKQ